MNSADQSTPARVLITGGAGGMAQGIAQAAASLGHSLLLADLDHEGAQKSARNICRAGGVAYGFEVDVTSETSVSRLYDEVLTEVGGIDVLINAAGVLDRKYLEDHSASSFDEVMDINLNGPFRMVRHFGSYLRQQGWGRIINISSIAGRTGYPYPSYAASKAGLSNLTRSLMIDFWGSGVTINSVSPGVVNTGMPMQAVRDQVPKKVPTTQVVQPVEVGHAVVFLMSEYSSNINGLDLVIDGGATSVFQFVNGPHQGVPD